MRFWTYFFALPVSGGTKNPRGLSLFNQPSLVIIPIDTAFAVNADESQLLDALQGIIDQRSEYSLDFELWFIAPITSPRYASTDEAKLEALRKYGAEWASAKANVL